MFYSNCGTSSHNLDIACLLTRYFAVEKCENRERKNIYSCRLDSKKRLLDQESCARPLDHGDSLKKDLYL